jgi:hypothetical protein
VEEERGTSKNKITCQYIRTRRKKKTKLSEMSEISTQTTNRGHVRE